MFNKLLLLFNVKDGNELAEQALILFAITVIINTVFNWISTL